MNILFICKHNRFRSKVAEAFFNYYNKNKKIKVRSRGIIQDRKVHLNVIKVMKKKGVVLRDLKSRVLKKKEVDDADLIVIVADNLWIKFSKKKVLIWKISDTKQSDIKDIVKIIKGIEIRVKKLVRDLNK